MMIFVRAVVQVLCLCYLCGKVQLLFNGLAQKPPMGWMSWGYYECEVDCLKNPDKCLDENLIMSVTDHFYNDGYIEAGYEYIIIDDCWSERTRNEHNQLVPDRYRFPRGMKFLADYIHSKGLKFGMYTNIAEVTCKGYPGSKDHFEVDAKTFASWDVDYLKVDGCFVKEDYLNYAYIDLGKAIERAGRPMVYACSWPYYSQFIHNHTPNFPAVAETCHVFRNYHDIFPYWGNVHAIIKFYEDNSDVIARYHKPGSWFDPDMLLVGRGVLPMGQNRIQMAIYALLSAPLILSFDMNKIKDEEKDLLLNLHLIAIAQDPMGLLAKPKRLQPGVTLWVKIHEPLKGNIYPASSFAVVNYQPYGADIEIKPSDYGLRCGDGYTIMDIFQKKFTQNITLNESISISVPPQDVVLYTLYPL